MTSFFHNENMGSIPIVGIGVWSRGKTSVFDIEHKGSIPFALKVETVFIQLITFLYSIKGIYFKGRKYVLHT